MAIRRAIAEPGILLVGSILTGFIIGTAQHYVAFGVWEHGWDVEDFKLATFEGGILGAVVGIPTGS